MLQEFLKSVVTRSQFATMPSGGGGSQGPVVFTSTGDKFRFAAAVPIRLLKWGFIVDDTALVTGGTNLQLNLDLRPQANSDTNRVNLDTLTVVDPNSAYTLGTGAYRDPFTVSSVTQTPASEVASAGPFGGVTSQNQNIAQGQQQITVSAGQELVAKVQVAATTSGKGTIFIEYVLLPITKPSSYGFGALSPDGVVAGSVSLTDTLTRLAS